MRRQLPSQTIWRRKSPRSASVGRKWLLRHGHRWLRRIGDIGCLSPAAETEWSSGRLGTLILSELSASVAWSITAAEQMRQSGLAHRTVVAQCTYQKTSLTWSLKRTRSLACWTGRFCIGRMCAQSARQYEGVDERGPRAQVIQKRDPFV